MYCVHVFHLILCTGTNIVTVVVRIHACNHQLWCNWFYLPLSLQLSSLTLTSIAVYMSLFVLSIYLSMYVWTCHSNRAIPECNSPFERHSRQVQSYHECWLSLCVGNFYVRANAIGRDVWISVSKQHHVWQHQLHVYLLLIIYYICQFEGVNRTLLWDVCCTSCMCLYAIHDMWLRAEVFIHMKNRALFSCFSILVEKWE